MNEHQGACIHLLADYGINSRDVLYDGVYADGYERIRRDTSGNRIVINEEVATEFIAWPTHFPVDEFFEHYWAWKGAVIPWTITIRSTDACETLPQKPHC